MFFKKFFWGALGAWLFLGILVAPYCLAASDYVLPYPGIMPGHKLYRLEQVIDRLFYFWAFGSLAKHKYELGMADKKLVEAKTLFDYHQFLLATKALQASDQHFQKAILCLDKAEGEGKNIEQKSANLKAAGVKHQEVLGKLQSELPESFVWQPEETQATQLNLKELVKEAIKLREI